MKVSYNNYPVLKMLSDNDIYNFCPLKCDLPGSLESHIKAFRRGWILYHKFFENCDIIVVAKPFAEAALLAQDKLLEASRAGLTPEIHFPKGELGEDVISCVAVLPGVVYMYHGGIKDGEVLRFILFAFSPIGTPLGFAIIDDNGENIWKTSNDSLSHWQGPVAAANTINTILMFRAYADVEIKQLLPGKKIKDIDCNYKNETKLPITILDSKWFTTLVKSDEFKVRGHFRLQPCGEGHKDRKLIWVSDFMKHGYTAPARKLKNESNGSKTNT